MLLLLCVVSMLCKCKHFSVIPLFAGWKHPKAVMVKAAKAAMVANRVAHAPRSQAIRRPPLVVNPKTAMIHKSVNFTHSTIVWRHWKSRISHSAWCPRARRKNSPLWMLTRIICISSMDFARVVARVCLWVCVLCRVRVSRCVLSIRGSVCWPHFALTNRLKLTVNEFRSNVYRKLKVILKVILA